MNKFIELTCTDDTGEFKAMINVDNIIYFCPDETQRGNVLVCIVGDNNFFYPVKENYEQVVKKINSLK